MSKWNTKIHNKKALEETENSKERRYFIKNPQNNFY